MYECMNGCPLEGEGTWHLDRHEDFAGLPVKTPALFGLRVGYFRFSCIEVWLYDVSNIVIEFGVATMLGITLKLAKAEEVRGAGSQDEAVGGSSLPPPAMTACSNHTAQRTHVAYAVRLDYCR